MSELKMLKRVEENLLHELHCRYVISYSHSKCDCVRRDFRRYIRKVKARKS